MKTKLYFIQVKYRSEVDILCILSLSLSLSIANLIFDLIYLYLLTLFICILVTASGGAASTEEISDEWLTFEEDTQTEGIDIPSEGKNLPYHRNQQSQVMAQVMEIYAPFAVQTAKEDEAINGGCYQYEAGVNNGNSSAKIRSTGVYEYDEKKPEYIINV
jgi:hypothetical protein